MGLHNNILTMMINEKDISVPCGHRCVDHLNTPRHLLPATLVKGAIWPGHERLPSVCHLGEPVATPAVCRSPYATLLHGRHAVCRLAIRGEDQAVWIHAWIHGWWAGVWRALQRLRDSLARHARPDLLRFRSWDPINPVPNAVHHSNVDHRLWRARRFREQKIP